MSVSAEHEHYEALLMKAVDGLLSASERDELDAHLADCEVCGAELADFRRIKETTDAMTQRILQDVAIEPPRETRPVRWFLGTSFLVMLLGALLLGGFAAYSLFGDPKVPLVVKIGSGAMALGLLGLLAYVLRVRARAAGGRDPYEEIDR